MKKVIYFNEGKELAFYQKDDEVLFTIKNEEESELIHSITMSEVEDMVMELTNILEQFQDERFEEHS
jgi:hypothetical protein